MKYFLDETGAKYVVQKIKDTVRVMPCNELDEVQNGQMGCLPVADYQDEYLTLSALEDGQIEIIVPTAVDGNYATSLSYTKDKSSWPTPISITNAYQSIKIPVSAGDDVYLKGIAQQWTNSGSGLVSTTIKSTANIIVSGNAMSLLYGDDFKGKVTFPEGSKYNFRSLFQDNTHLINAENLVLPATMLTLQLNGEPVPNSGCYQNMFYNCSSLTAAPALPATELASYCYSSMFRGCKLLTKTPKLPAETLASYCYYYMFYGCTSLTTVPELPATTLTERGYCSMFQGCDALITAPELPATTLAPNCYQSMFQGCTSLTTAPVLPATVLTDYCYYYMFYNCSKLNNITMHATDISAYNCLSDWVNGVSSTGTFTKAASMTSLPTGTSGIPTGWTVVNK